MYYVPRLVTSNAALRICLALILCVGSAVGLFILLREPLTGLEPTSLIAPRHETLTQHGFSNAVVLAGVLSSLVIEPRRLWVSLLGAVLAYSTIMMGIEGFRGEVWKMSSRGYFMRYGELLLLSTGLFWIWQRVHWRLFSDGRAW